MTLAPKTTKVKFHGGGGVHKNREEAYKRRKQDYYYIYNKTNPSPEKSKMRLYFWNMKYRCNCCHSNTAIFIRLSIFFEK